ncbi:MAG TPA: hypothetical protein P5077_10330 [bacterium]|nr:hypothetical protein [bacterium]
MDIRIFMKSLNDIDIKLMLCKSNFQWKLLAEKYDEAERKIQEFYGAKIPNELTDALGRVRLQLVEKKGHLPPEDILV